jgi:hypothetical protein
MPKITTTLVADKVTKGAVRFAEPEATIGETPISIYLRNEMIEFMGRSPEDAPAITLTIVSD